MRRSTRNWIIIGVISIVLISVFLFFSTATEPYTSARNQANNIAYKSAKIIKPDYFANFTQDKQYYSVGGLTAQNHYRYVVINAKNGKIKILKNSSHSRASVITSVTNKYHPKKINHIDLGLIDNKPVWEVSFVNKDNSIGYSMVDFKNGKITETINNI